MGSSLNAGLCSRISVGDVPLIRICSLYLPSPTHPVTRVQSRCDALKEQRIQAIQDNRSRRCFDVWAEAERRTQEIGHLGIMGSAKAKRATDGDNMK